MLYELHSFNENENLIKALMKAHRMLGFTKFKNKRFYGK